MTKYLRERHPRWGDVWVLIGWFDPLAGATRTGYSARLRPRIDFPVPDSSLLGLSSGLMILDLTVVGTCFSSSSKLFPTCCRDNFRANRLKDLKRGEKHILNDGQCFHFGNESPLTCPIRIRWKRARAFHNPASTPRWLTRTNRCSFCSVFLALSTCEWLLWRPSPEWTGQPDRIRIKWRKLDAPVPYQGRFSRRFLFRISPEASIRQAEELRRNAGKFNKFEFLSFY